MKDREVEKRMFSSLNNNTAEKIILAITAIAEIITAITFNFIGRKDWMFLSFNKYKNYDSEISLNEF